MRYWILALVLLVAGPAMAVNDWGYTGCPGSGNSVGSGGKICFDLNTSFSTAYTTFNVIADSALACLKTDVDQEGVSATGASPVTAIVRYCPNGDNSAAANCGIQACVTGGCTLTGLNGVPASQLACVVLGPGAYRVDFPTLPDTPDVGLFTVEGSN